MIQTRERTWTDDAAVFVEQVTCALKGRDSLHLHGYASEPTPVRGNTLLRCSVSFDELFTDMDGEMQCGYEYRVQNTLDGVAAPDSAREFLHDTCKSIVSRLTVLEHSLYGLPAPLSAHKLGDGIGIWFA